MTRYLKPDASKSANNSYALVKFGDEVAFPVVSSILGVCCFAFGIGMATASPWFLLLLSPLLLILGVWGLYYSNTEQLAGEYGRDVMYERCTKEYKKTIGDHTQELARPIIDKVWEHALTRHAGGGGKYAYLDEYTDCKVCAPRLEVLKNLAPTTKSIESNDDIEQAKLFLQARKEITGA